MVACASVATLLLCICVIVVCFFTTYYRAFPFFCSFFLVHLFHFLSPYIESIWSFISSVFQMFFASPMWAELNDVRAPSLRCVAKKLPEVVLGSRADSTTLTYLNSFKRWRAWANRFPEVAVLPATPAYVSSYLLSVLQASSSPAPVQNALYSIRWAHDFAGFDSPTNHTLPQEGRGGGRKGLRWRGFALFLVRFCGNFYFHSRYCGFKTLSGLRLLQPDVAVFGEKKKKVSAVITLFRTVGIRLFCKREPSVLFYNASGFIISAYNLTLWFAITAFSS